MNFTQLANLGEFLGGFGVVFTLLYLARQIRVSNLGERAANHRALIEQWNQAFVDPLRDPTRVPLLRRAFADFDSLTEDEKTVAGMFFAGAMNVCDQAHALRGTPAILPETTSVYDAVAAAILQVPGPRSWWSKAQYGWAPTFQAKIAEVLASENPPPPITQWMPFLIDRGGASDPSVGGAE